ncbi:MAG: hypothetical protein AAF927_30445 [Bacteroidota bacterium]
MEKIIAALLNRDNYFFAAGLISVYLLSKGFSGGDSWSTLLVGVGIICFIAFWIRHSGLVLGFIRDYGRYFYISLLYFAVLGLVLANFEQANSLFLNFLEEGWNHSFYMFSVQLPLSIMVVWFLPYYLMFSKSFYREFLGKQEAQHMSWGDFFANVFFPFQAVILKIRASDPEGGEVLKKRFQSFNEESKSLHKVFHIIRRLAGAIYIVILMRLLQNVAVQLGSDAWYIKNCTTLCLVMIAFFYVWAWFTNQWVFNSDEARDNSLQRPRVFWAIVVIWFLIFIGLTLINDVFISDWNIYNVILISSVPLVLILIYWWLLPLSESLKKLTPKREILAPQSETQQKIYPVFLYVLLLFLVVSAVWAVYWLVRAPGNDEDITNINHLILSGYGLLLFFMSFAYLRRKGRHAFGFKNWIGGLLKVLDEPGNAILMVGNLGLLILFIAAFLGAIVDYESDIAPNAHVLNPINVFFLFVNGLIVLIAILDRALVIYARYLSLKKDGKTKGLFLRKNQKDSSRSRIFFLPSSITITNQDGNRDYLSYLEHLSLVSIRKAEKFLFSQKKELMKVVLEFYRNNRVRVVFNASLIGLIILIAWRANIGNDFHSLQYHKAETINPVDLEQFTKTFLENHDSSRPIYFIAGDGGGLKAAYWTLKILSELEQNQPDSFHFATDVFASAGASGGSVGLGIYTFMYGIADEEQRAESPFHMQLHDEIDSIGRYNLLSADLIGLFSRWPLKLSPRNKTAVRPDRMDVLARNMFQNAAPIDDFDFDSFNQEAYAQLWANYQKQSLPLFITNTARMEDGSKGIMHPLKPEDASEIWGGTMDLTYQGLDAGGKIGAETRSLSYSDALMTTNRFPIFSPMAKIEGRGHFVDAGAVDNSGKGTILQLLQYMKQKAEQGNPIFCEFFDQNRIVLLSIRCDKQRYHYEQFKDFVPHMTQTDQRYYVSTYLGGAINTGLTGGPRQYEGLLDQETHRKAHGLDAIVVNLSIPFYVDSLEDIFSVLGSKVEKGAVVYHKMDSIRADINDSLYVIINDTLPIKLGNERPKYLEPPLARTLSRSTRTYMNRAAAKISKGFEIEYDPVPPPLICPPTPSPQAQSNPKDSRKDP